jgi:hypothetical protein
MRRVMLVCYGTRGHSGALAAGEELLKEVGKSPHTSIGASCRAQQSIGPLQ